MQKFGRCHKWGDQLWVILWGPLCAQGVLGNYHEEVRDTNDPSMSEGLVFRVQIECEEYFAKYCQSCKTLLWL